MSTDEVLLGALLVVPSLGGLLTLLARSGRGALLLMCVTVFGWTVVAAVSVGTVFTQVSLHSTKGWFFLDGLSAYNLMVMAIIYGLSSAFAWRYFGAELEKGELTLRQARVFSVLWCQALSSMSLVLISNNLAILWIGIEATTLLTAFLISLHTSRVSLEAMWKYLLICSVGVGFAFIGTVITAAAAIKAGLPVREALLWTKLLEKASGLDPTLVKASFLFVLVGYGTKAGLAPMHNWLPDAHSQAPAPVSAIFSGFMLNAALYCIMRYLPIVEATSGLAGWARELIGGFGVLSILIAATFIIFQRDVKRLLAYHSVEHIGIIALGVGLGGLGSFAALFHTLNHSVCKTLSFFAAGRLGQLYQTHDMSRMNGVLKTSPIWGAGIFGSILALIGMAPFALFMSEFQIMRAAVDTRSFVWLGLFLVGASVVFVGALGHALQIAWKPAATQPLPERATILDGILVFLPLGALLLLGLWLPEPLRQAIASAAAVLSPS